MPWYQEGEDDRVWIVYVDAERTLQGFETFLDQYRALLASVPSGVTYVAPTVWHGVIQDAFTRALESRDAGIMPLPRLLRASTHGRGRAFKRAADTRRATAVPRTVRGVPHAGVRCALQTVHSNVEHLEH